MLRAKTTSSWLPSIARVNLLMISTKLPLYGEFPASLYTRGHLPFLLDSWLTISHFHGHNPDAHDCKCEHLISFGIMISSKRLSPDPKSFMAAGRSRSFPATSSSSSSAKLAVRFFFGKIWWFPLSGGSFHGWAVWIQINMTNMWRGQMVAQFWPIASGAVLPWSQPMLQSFARRRPFFFLFLAFPRALPS